MMLLLGDNDVEANDDGNSGSDVQRCQVFHNVDGPRILRRS